MVLAASLVEGEHDFTSFAAVDPERGRDGEPVSNLRRIFLSNWRREGDEFVYTIKGSGFLQHMVRNLVGTFILVGKGTLQVEDIARILEARNRSLPERQRRRADYFWYTLSTRDVSKLIAEHTENGRGDRGRLFSNFDLLWGRD